MICDYETLRMALRRRAARHMPSCLPYSAGVELTHNPVEFLLFQDLFRLECLQLRLQHLDATPGARNVGQLRLQELQHLGGRQRFEFRGARGHGR